LFDRDGVVRRTLLCFGESKDGAGDLSSWPHLMELIYRAVNDRASPAYASLDNCDQPLLMPFADRSAFAQVPYSAVIAGQIPAAFLKDRIILVGAVAHGLGDQHPVPFAIDGPMSGVEIMANMLNDMMADNFITPVSLVTQIILSLIPVWILLI